jgi:hypothetical protein
LVASFLVLCSPAFCWQSSACLLACMLACHAPLMLLSERGTCARYQRSIHPLLGSQNGTRCSDRGVESVDTGVVRPITFRLSVAICAVYWLQYYYCSSMLFRCLLRRECLVALDRQDPFVFAEKFAELENRVPRSLKGNRIVATIGATRRIPLHKVRTPHFSNPQLLLSCNLLISCCAVEYAAI